MTTEELPPISAARYTSEAFARLEWERMWPRTWVCAGPAADVEEPGSFFAFELGPESLLVVRGEDGRLRCFHNVCPHRGSILCEQERGRTSTLRCPFHSWTWHLDGTLRSVMDPEHFPQARTPGRLDLSEVACAEWAGFVWVRLDPEGEPLESYLGPVRSLVEAYEPERWALVDDITVEVRCNWKASVDVFNEGYHVHALHPEVLPIIVDTDVRADPLGRHARIHIPHGAPSPRLPPSDRLLPAQEELLRRSGIDPATFQGTGADVRLALQRHLRATGAAEGFDDSRLSDEQLSDAHLFHVFPNVQLSYYARLLLLFRHRPHPTDPGRTLFDSQVYERLPRGAPRPPRPPHRLLKPTDTLPGTVITADVRLLDGLQRGLRSRGQRGLQFGTNEAALRHMHQVLDAYLAAPPGSPPAPPSPAR